MAGRLEAGPAEHNPGVHQPVTVLAPKLSVEKMSSEADDVDVEASIFGAALRKLAPLTEQLARSLDSSSKGPLPPFTKLVVGSRVTGEVFGVAISSTSRPVVINDLPAAVEHTFLGTYEGATSPLLRVYQWPAGYLTVDTTQANRLCDVDNPYVAKKLIAKLVAAVRQGPFFTPAPDPRFFDPT